MALYLVQHGISLTKEEDPAKGLAPNGRDDTVRIAEVAKMYGILVEEICHSGKKRAEQTAGIFAEYLAPIRGVSQIDGIKPLDDVKAFSEGIDVSKNVMAVGHLPFMERLTGHLTCGSEETRVFKFQNSGIVCLDQDGDDWFIKWSLNPNIV